LIVCLETIASPCCASAWQGIFFTYQDTIIRRSAAAVFLFREKNSASAAAALSKPDLSK